MTFRILSLPENHPVQNSSEQIFQRFSILILFVYRPTHPTCQSVAQAIDEAVTEPFQGVVTGAVSRNHGRNLAMGFEALVESTYCLKRLSSTYFPLERPFAYGERPFRTQGLNNLFQGWNMLTMWAEYLGTSKWGDIPQPSA